MNLLEAFSDKKIDHARKIVTLIREDSSCISDGPMPIVPCYVVDGTITNHVPPRYTGGQTPILQKIAIEGSGVLSHATI